MKYYTTKEGLVLTRKEYQDVVKNDAYTISIDPKGFDALDFYFGVLATNSKYKDLKQFN